MWGFKKWVLVAWILLGWNSADASANHIYVISDIDDTIELSQVRMHGQILRFIMNQINSHDSFIGMPALYQVLASEGVKFHYVTGAPPIVRRIPEKFLQSTGFPSGNLWLRPFRTKTYKFKFERIKDIISNTLVLDPNAKFVLIGDNGEKDVSVYDDVAKIEGIKDKVLITLIHHLYLSPPGEKPSSAQKSFFTAADAALYLFEADVITLQELKLVSRMTRDGIKSRFKSIKNRGFPDFAAVDPTVLENLRERICSVKDSETRQYLEEVSRELEVQRQKGPPKTIAGLCHRLIRLITSP